MLVLNRRTVGRLKERAAQKRVRRQGMKMRRCMLFLSLVRDDTKTSPFPLSFPCVVFIEREEQHSQKRHEREAGIDQQDTRDACTRKAASGKTPYRLIHGSDTIEKRVYWQGI